MYLKMLGQLTGALVKASYLLGMLWLYASRPSVLVMSLVGLSIGALLVAGLRTGR